MLENATTEKGVLHNLAWQEDYETFPVPGDIGGRYSVLTVVRLLPLADIDIVGIMSGTRCGCSSTVKKNRPTLYLPLRHAAPDPLPHYFL